MAERHFLITGSTGNLGFALLRRILTRTPHRITALVRPEGERLVTWSLQQLGVESGDRLVFLEGDIAVPWCGVHADDRRLAGVTDLVHCAADVRWHAAAELLLRTNVAGTRNVLDVAGEIHRRAPLSRVTVVSSCYVTGVSEETVPEEPIRPSRFNNAYEASKFLMEREALSRPGLPINVVRPSSIVGDSSDGVVQRFSTLYFPFRLVMENQLYVLPGYRDAVLDIVPCNYVAEVICALHEQGYGPGEVVHACGGDTVISLADIWDLACETFDRLVPRSRPRRPGPFLSPPVARRAGVLAPALPRRVAQVLRQLVLYVPYLSARRRFANRKAQSLGLAPVPALESYADPLCAYAVECRFRDAARRLPPAAQAEPRRSAGAVAQQWSQT